MICGHIHQPVISTIETDKGSVEYLNSGDWVENFTALEYDKGEWAIYKHAETKVEEEESEELEDMITDIYKWTFNEQVTDSIRRVKGWMVRETRATEKRVVAVMEEMVVGILEEWLVVGIPEGEVMEGMEAMEGM